MHNATKRILDILLRFLDALTSSLKKTKHYNSLINNIL